MSNQENQGEGNREAARDYNERTRDFVNSERGREAADGDHGGDDAEGREAREEAEARAAEKDPAVARDYDRPACD